MADDLVITVQAQVASAIKALAEVQASLHSMSATATAQNVKAAASHNVLRTAMNEVKVAGGAMATGAMAVGREAVAAGEKVRGLAGEVAQMARGFLVGVGAMSPFIGLLTLAGVGFGLSQIIKQTKEFDAAVYSLSLKLNGDVELASQWIGIGKEFGLEASDVARAIQFLSTHIDQNSAVLKSMGIATEDAHGKLLPMRDVLEQARTWFQEHANATNLAARAQELFGRSGADMLPILMLDKQTFKEVTDELQKLGLIMSKDSLQAAQQFEFEIQHANMALEGLTITIGHQLLPGLAALADALSTWVVAHIQEIAMWVAKAVGFIIGLVEALTGQNFELSKTAQALGTVGAAYGNTGNAADTLANSTGGVTAAQRALEEQTRNTVNALKSQIDTIDDQIKTLNAATQQENHDDEMIRLNQERVKKHKETEKLRSDYQQALMIGDLASARTIFDQLNGAVQSEADSERAITKAQDQWERQTKISALNDAKQKLNDQINAVQEASRQQVQAMQDAASGMTRAIGGATGDIKSLVGDMATQMKAILNQGGIEAGKAWGNSVKEWISDTGKMMEADAKAHGPIYVAFHVAGKAIGEAFISGASAAIWEWVKGPFTSAWEKLKSDPLSFMPGHDQSNKNPFGGDGGHAVGFTVPGPVGSPRWELLHGGERVSPANSQEASSRTPSGATINIAINGVSDPEAVWRFIRPKLAEAMGAR